MPPPKSAPAEAPPAKAPPFEAPQAEAPPAKAPPFEAPQAKAPPAKAPPAKAPPSSNSPQGPPPRKRSPSRRNKIPPSVPNRIPELVGETIVEDTDAATGSSGRVRQAVEIWEKDLQAQAPAPTSICSASRNVTWKLENGRWICVGENGIRTDFGPLTTDQIEKLGEDVAALMITVRDEAQAHVAASSSDRPTDVAESSSGVLSPKVAAGLAPLPLPTAQAKAPPGPEPPLAIQSKARQPAPDGFSLRTTDAPVQELPAYRQDKAWNPNLHDWLVNQVRLTPPRSSPYDFSCEWQCRTGKLGSTKPKWTAYTYEQQYAIWIACTTPFGQDDPPPIARDSHAPS